MADIQVEIANLANMAEVNTQQGNLEEALQLHQQSLKLCEQIGDLEGKAANLSQMARIIAQQGDSEQGLELCKQAALALVEIKAYPDLVTVLANLARLDESKSLVYLAQAIWLSLTTQFPLEGLITLLVALARSLSPKDVLVSLIGTTVMFLCSQAEQEEPELEQFQELGISMLEAAASAEGVQDRDGFKSWFVQKRLNEPDFFFPELIQQLEASVGNDWLFDRQELIEQ